MIFETASATAWIDHCVMQALYMLGDITAGPAFKFTQWLQLVRKRTAKHRPSGFPHRNSIRMSSNSWLVL